MTPMWQNSPHLAEIRRRSIRLGYDGSEARNNRLAHVGDVQTTVAGKSPDGRRGFTSWTKETLIPEVTNLLSSFGSKFHINYT